MNGKLEDINIGGQLLGNGHRPYVVAELSANHNGDLNNALKLIELAKENGADAVKIQTYTADTITLKSDRAEFQINHGPWAGHSLYDLYEWAHTPWEWHPALFQKAREVGITLFSSPFDETAVALLEELNCPAYKIASFEINDVQLIEAVSRTGKPVIISTGVASESDIELAVSTARGAGCKNPILLKCVSSYPAKAEDYHLATMNVMKERFGCHVGLSDHTIDHTAAIVSTALGAVFLEKHFTLNRNGGGPDDSFSMEPDDLKSLVEGVSLAYQSLGSQTALPQQVSSENKMFKRSLYFVKAGKTGSRVTSDMVRSVRPNNGLEPIHLKDIVGKVLKTDVLENTPVSFEVIER